ncbi:C39 family peptidase [Cyanobium sp. Cruz CV13-4-11]|uniref:C39 family peptidase n=1 Tax=unclassified Cyanobium TaxID=2627006 RepID=UPI0020CCD22A|nr:MULTISPECIES: C39 family peptidase [unclassified Cyanobium]MCP9901968.1 C39 family peptidase [Cyanobium sp. Cruz CV11-17]MCP9920858.1 C39 family peptidase [Cyanobium sp. Cruz CV13-4-11]
MSRPIPSGDYVEHFDPELPHHRAWLLAVLEQLVAHDPQALEEGGTLRRLWTARQEAGSAVATPSPSPSPPAGAPSKGNPLSVPWFAQLDSATDQARRMCFSSSCAMLLAFLKPGVLTGFNGDDQYLARVRQFGDTTDAAAQIRALASYGIKARFTSRASFATLEQKFAAGIPVPCGYLHRGPISSPAGGGHWLIVVGITQTHVIVHDPLGEADLVDGTTIGGTARFCRYTRANFGRRWMVEGEGSGWAVLAER